jgi:flagellar basal-body rod protein FlgF
MDRALYISMTGAKQTMLAQAANNHNLANVSTTGFRADLHQFRSMPIQGDGYASRVYAMAERGGTDLSFGSIQATGKELDLAITGEGWIAVELPDGSEAYTRAGNLRLQPEGALTTVEGFPIIGNGGPIVLPPIEKMEIGTDGSISILPVGQEATTLALIDRIKLVNLSENQLVKGKYGLMRLEQGGDSEADGSVTVVSGALESSNVNSVDSLVRLISLARQFEMQIKGMKTAEELDAVATQMMSFS